MTDRRKTIAILAVTILALIVWDVYVVFFTAETGDSISEVLRDASTYASVVPAALGFLMGHLFWPHPTRSFHLVGTCSTAGAFVARDVVAFFVPALAVVWWPIVALLLCVPLGHWFWPQRPKGRRT